MTVGVDAINKLTARDYEKAFRVIEPNLTQAHVAMLRFHYGVPERTATSKQLAQAAGYSGTANLHYGFLAGKPCEVFGIRLPDNVLVNVLVTFPNLSNKLDWIMRSQVAEALELLEWVQPSAGVEQTDGSSLTEIEVFGTHKGDAGPDNFSVTLPAKVAKLKLLKAVSREAAIRKAIALASGLSRQVLSDLYRQLVLGNYARLDGKGGNAARAALDRRYPDHGMLAGFEIKSGTNNTAGLILYNLLQNPSPRPPATGCWHMF